MKRLQINLDELAFILHRGKLLDMYCFLNTSTGEILNIPSDRKTLEAMFRLPENSAMLTTADLVSRMVPPGVNFLTVPDLFSQNVFNLMTEFIDSVQTLFPTETEALIRAVHQEGGWKDFHDIVRSNEELLAKYIRFRDRFFESSARRWLEEKDIELV